jgi:carotenoid cleavage dioxygenase-like enzyme
MKGVLFNFDPTHRFRIGITPKNSTDNSAIRWFEIPEALVVIHTMNAWEQINTDTGNREIVLWVPLGKIVNCNMKLILYSLS